MISIAAAAFVTSAFASDGRKQNCQPPARAVERLILIPDTPNYFFRAFPDKNWVSYNGDGKNKILNLDNSKFHTLPGQFDPVPLWNESVITQPSESTEFRENDGMKFYSVTEILSGKKDIKPLFMDKNTIGVYQSIGTRSKTQVSEVFRIMTDRHGVSLTDYQVTNAVAGGRPRVTPLGPQREICSGKDLKLPMISKNGLEMTAWDPKTQTTKIFNISAGKCIETADLGFAAGKADFSFDGTQLTFHTVGNGDEAGKYFAKDSELSGMNVYVFDRKTKGLRQITKNISDNSYYPVFRRDGKIIFVHKDSSTGQFSFAVADPNKVTSVSVPDCKDQPKKVADAFRVLTGMVAQYCSQGTFKNQDALTLFTLGLSGSQCRAIVEEQLKSFGKLPNNLVAADVTAACPKGGDVAVVGHRSTQSAITDPKVLFKNRCAICHSGGSMKIDFEKPSSLSSAKAKSGKSLAWEITSQIKSGAMPRGGSLSNAEKQLMVDWISKPSQ